MAVQNIWKRVFRKPQHLMTIAKAFGQTEQVTINMYFDDPKELGYLIDTANVAVSKRADEVQKEQVAFEAKIQKQVKDADKADKGNK